MTDNVIAILAILGLVVFFLLLPARYDPAVRLKEWNESKRNNRS